MKPSSNRINQRSSPMRLYIHNMFVEHDIFLTQGKTSFNKGQSHKNLANCNAGVLSILLVIDFAQHLSISILPDICLCRLCRLFIQQKPMFHILYSIFFLMYSIGTMSLPSIDFLQVKRSF